MKTTSFSFILSFLFLANLYSQDCDNYSIDVSWDFQIISSQDDIQQGDIFFIECYVTEFTDILAFHFTLEYDNDILEFFEFDDLGSELIGPVETNTAIIENGQIPIIWTNLNGTPQTISDGGIFKVFFEVRGNPNECFTWDINSNLIDIEIAYEIENNLICTEDNIDFKFTPSEFCVGCSELYAYHNSCQGSIEFYACGGEEPYTYTLEGPTGLIGSGTFNSTDSILYTNLESGLHILTLQDNVGNTIPFSQSTIDVFDTQVSFISQATVCNDGSVSYESMLDLDELITSNRPYSIYGPTGDILNSSVVDFLGQEVGIYEYQFLVEGPHPCPDTVYTTLINVIDCECPIIGLNQLGEFCDMETIDFASYLFPGSEQGSFSIIDQLGDTIPLQNNETIISLDQLNAGMYTLFYQLESPVPACAEFVQSSFEVIESIDVTFNDYLTICNSDSLGNSTIINLDTVVVGAPGFWSGPGDNMLTTLILDFNGSPVGVETYTFTTTNAVPPCQNEIISISIEVQDCINTSTQDLTNRISSIYPNPSSGVFSIELEKPANAKIFDVHGKLSLEASLSTGMNIINSSGLMEGLYFLVIYHESTIIDSQKLFIE